MPQIRLPPAKDVKNLHELKDQIHVSIEHLADETKKRLQNDRANIWIKLSEELQRYKDELEAENEKRRKNEKEKEDNEESLLKRLRLMTEIAEKTDKENQSLIKLNDRLNIEFKSQDQDHELLMKQIVYHKEQEIKLQKHHHELKVKVDEIEKTRKQNDDLLDMKRPPTSSVQFAGNKSGKQRATMFSVGGASSYHPLPPGDKRSGTAQMGKRNHMFNTRPHTAVNIPGLGEQRPQTGAVPQAVFGTNSLANFGRPDRATSAIVFDVNENLGRYEEIIQRMKKNLEREKQNIRHVRTQIAREIKQKTEMEKILRQCVDDVKNEISKKRIDSKSVYRKSLIMTSASCPRHSRPTGVP